MAIHCKLSREFHISIVIETFRITCMVDNFTFTEDDIFWLCCPRILINLCRLILPSGLGHTTISPSKGRKSQKMFPVCIICTAVHPMNSTEHCKSYTSTHQHWNTETLKHCNTETLKHWNTATLQHWNTAMNFTKQWSRTEISSWWMLWQMQRALWHLTGPELLILPSGLVGHTTILPPKGRKFQKCPQCASSVLQCTPCIILNCSVSVRKATLQHFNTETLKHCHTAMNFTMQWSRT